jgi:hypothetical protein
MITKRLPQLLALTLLAAGAGSHAWAKDFQIPEKHPVISVTYPDSWEPEEIDRGVQGQTKDTAVYLAIETSKSEKGMKAIIDESFDLFNEHKLVVNKDSKQVNKFEIAGEAAEELVYTGKDEDGPATISITTMQIGDTVVVVTYWATTESESKYHAAILKIIKSIKKVD